MKIKSNVYYQEEVKYYLDQLIETLYRKGYFGNRVAAKRYVHDMKTYFDNRLPNLHHLGLNKKAQPYFDKYGEELYMVDYHRPKTRTTWYAFYEVFDNRLFAITYITNNHSKDAAYIN